MYKLLPNHSFTNIQIYAYQKFATNKHPNILVKPKYAANCLRSFWVSFTSCSCFGQKFWPPFQLESLHTQAVKHAWFIFVKFCFSTLWDFTPKMHKFITNIASWQNCENKQRAMLHTLCIVVFYLQITPWWWFSELCLVCHVMAEEILAKYPSSRVQIWANQEGHVSPHSG